MRFLAVRLHLYASAVLLLGSACGQTLEFWTILLSPRFDTYFKETFERYEASHPGVRIRWRDLSLQGLALELDRFSEASAPDVVNLNVPLLLAALEAGGLEPIEGSFDESRYFSGLLESLRVEGQLYALPWYVTPPVTFLNPELWEEAGVEANAAESWDNLWQASASLHERTGSYGFLPNLSGQNLLYRFAEAGLPILGEDGTRAVFNSPAHRALLERYLGAFEADLFPAEAFRGYGGGLERFESGDLAALLAGPQVLSRLHERAPELYETLAVAPYPLGAGRVVHTPLMAIAIPTGSDAPEAALEFVRYLTGAGRQLAFSRVAGVLPSAILAAQDPFFRVLPLEPSLEDEARVLAARQLPYARDLTLALPNAEDLLRMFQREVEMAFFGAKSAQEALDDAVRYWNAKL